MTNAQNRPVADVVDTLATATDDSDDDSDDDRRRRLIVDTPATVAVAVARRAIVDGPLNTKIHLDNSSQKRSLAQPKNKSI